MGSRRWPITSLALLLPQLDAVALWIGDPREPSVIVVLNFLDGDAVLAKLGQHPLQTGHPVVDHEGGPGRAKVIRIRREQRPDRAARRKISVARFRADAEMLPIPRDHAFRITHLEEDAADAGHFFHVIILFLLGLAGWLAWAC